MSREVEVCCLPVLLIDAEDVSERGEGAEGIWGKKERRIIMGDGWRPFLLYLFITSPV